MKAIIQAGGIGSRLRPITLEIPKPLITVKKKPIINHLINFLLRYKIKEFAIIVNVNHKEDYARWLKTWKDELPFRSIRLFYEDRPSGTFGWLRNLKHWIGSETFVLTGADLLMDFDLNMVKRFHKKHKPIATIPLVFNDNPKEYGVPVLRGVLIKDFIEKPARPTSHFISSGLYIVEPAIFRYDDKSKQFVMIERDIFPKMAKDGQLAGIKMRKARFYECGNLERWERAIKEW